MPKRPTVVWRPILKLPNGDEFGYEDNALYVKHQDNKKEMIVFRNPRMTQEVSLLCSSPDAKHLVLCFKTTPTVVSVWEKKENGYRRIRKHDAANPVCRLLMNEDASLIAVVTTTPEGKTMATSWLPWDFYPPKTFEILSPQAIAVDFSEKRLYYTDDGKILVDWVDVSSQTPANECVSLENKPMEVLEVMSGTHRFWFGLTGASQETKEKEASDCCLGLSVSGNRRMYPLNVLSRLCGTCA